MIDPTSKIQMLETLISELDPRIHEVVVAHLRDAVDALYATSRDRPTRYARSADLVDGAVAHAEVGRLFR